MEETQNAPAPESTAAAAAPAPVAQAIPDRPPIEGTRFVKNSTTGLYDVVREEEPKPDEKKAQALPDEKKDKGQEPERGVALPDTLPDHIRDNPEIQTLVSEGAAAMKQGGEYTDEQAQRVVDLIAQFELEIGTEQPPLFEEDRIRSILKARWGDGYAGRLELVNKYVQARPALRAYLNRTGAGNQLSVIEALGMIATGVTALTPAEAAERMTAMRQDPKSPLRDPYHKHHKVVVQQAKVWADIIERGEKKQAGENKADVQSMVKNRLDAQRQAKGETGDPATEKLHDRVRAIRSDPNYWKKDNAALHRSLVGEMHSLMRQLYGNG